MKRPSPARQHCRHYSYDRKGWPEVGGPTCALGLDLSAPAASNACMPTPELTCAKREDWTAQERADWEAWVKHRLTAMSTALDAMEPVPEGYKRTIECPHCDGVFSVSRVGKSAYASCSNTECACHGETHFNLGHGEPWPALTKEPTP